ncbi:MAG TPA: hypothetical protein VIS52_00965, partial [Motiliproteus sp.]
QASVAASSSVTGPQAAVQPFCDTWCRDPQSLSVAAQACVGHRYGTNGYALDYQAMNRSCAQAAVLGDATAQTLLGEIHFLGLGVNQDFTLAYQWYQQAAAQQHAHAELMMYEMTRLHLVATAAQPQQWLQRAAQNGHPQARLLLQAAL